MPSRRTRSALGEGALHHPDRAAGPGQRLLRHRRVLARALARGPSSRRWPRTACAARVMALVAMDEIGDYIAACQVGITMASIAHRRARRAGDRPRVRAAARRRARPLGRGRDLGGDRLPAHHRRPEHRRRDRPQALHDPARRGSGPPGLAAAAHEPGPVLAVHRRAQLAPPTRCCAPPAPIPTPSPRAARRTRSSGSSPTRAAAAASTSARPTC